jgi:hypothetical protein
MSTFGMLRSLGVRVGEDAGERLLGLELDRPENDLLVAAEPGVARAEDAQLGAVEDGIHRSLNFKDGTLGELEHSGTRLRA